MTQFAKYLLKRQREEWKENYINYKLLKKSLKAISVENVNVLLQKFIDELDAELKKISVFYSQKEVELLNKLDMHEPKRRRVQPTSADTVVMPLIEIYSAICLELMDLLEFVHLNSMGVRKILKKHDKKMCTIWNAGDYDYLKTNTYLAKRLEARDSSLRKLVASTQCSALANKLEETLTDLFAIHAMGKSVSMKAAMKSLGEPPTIVMELRNARKRALGASRMLAWLARQETLDLEDEDDSDDGQATIRALPSLATSISRPGTVGSKEGVRVSVIVPSGQAIRMPDIGFRSEATSSHSQSVIKGQGSAHVGTMIFSRPSDLIFQLQHKSPEQTDPGSAEYAEAAEEVDNSVRLLVVLSCALFTANYAIVVPFVPAFLTSTALPGMSTAPMYMQGISLAAAPLGVVLAAPISSILASRSFKPPMVIGALLCAAGNVLGALGHAVGSLGLPSGWTFAISRLLFGLGCTLVVGRRYLSETVTNARDRRWLGAGLLVAGGLGHVAGYLLSALLVDSQDCSDHFICPNAAAAEWMMAGLWVCMLTWCLAAPVDSHFVEEARKRADSVNLLAVNLYSDDSVHAGDRSKPGKPATAAAGATVASDAETLVSVGSTFNSSPTSAGDLTERLVTPAWPESELLGKERGFEAHFRAVCGKRHVFTCIALATFRGMQEYLVNSTYAFTKNTYGWNSKDAALYLVAVCGLMVPVNIIVGLLRSWLSSRGTSGGFVDSRLLITFKFVLALCCAGLAVDWRIASGQATHTPLILYITTTVLAHAAVQVLFALSMGSFVRVLPRRIAIGSFGAAYLSVLAEYLGRLAANLYLIYALQPGFDTPLSLFLPLCIASGCALVWTLFTLRCQN